MYICTIYTLPIYLIILSNQLSKFALHMTSFWKTFTCLCVPWKKWGYFKSLHAHVSLWANTHARAYTRTHTHTQECFKSFPSDVVPCSSSIPFPYTEATDFNFLFRLYQHFNYCLESPQPSIRYSHQNLIQ